MRREFKKKIRTAEQVFFWASKRKERDERRIKDEKAPGTIEIHSFQDKRN